MSILAQRPSSDEPLFHTRQRQIKLRRSMSGEVDAFLAQDTLSHFLNQEVSEDGVARIREKIVLPAAER